MAVKVFCNICEIFIKDVEQYEFQKLTGKEICTECGKKVKETYDALEKMTTECKNQLDAKARGINKTYSNLQKVYDKYNSDIQSFHRTRKAELDRRMEDIL